MQTNSSTAATGSSSRNQTSDNRGSKSAGSHSSAPRRRRGTTSKPSTTTSTNSQNSQKSTPIPASSRGSDALSECEPPTQLLQELTIGAPRPSQPKRQLYSKRQESSTIKQSNTDTRSTSLPAQLQDTQLQQRLEEAGLADIEEDGGWVRVQRRVVSNARPKRSKGDDPSLLITSTAQRPLEVCSPGPSSQTQTQVQTQETDPDDLSLSSLSTSENVPFSLILARELRSLQDGTRSPKLLRSPALPPRSDTSSPESVIIEDKGAWSLDPDSFLGPKRRVGYPEGQEFAPLHIEAWRMRIESSSANPLLDSIQAVKLPSPLPHACNFGFSSPGQLLAFGDCSDYPNGPANPVHWTSPPRPIPALHGPSSIPYARCPSGAEGEVYDANLQARDLQWTAYQRGPTKESALHPDYVAVAESPNGERLLDESDAVVLVDADLAQRYQPKGQRRRATQSDRLCLPLADSTNPQHLPRRPASSSDHRSTQSGPHVRRAPSFRRSGASYPASPSYFTSPLGGLAVTAESPGCSERFEPAQASTPLPRPRYHTQSEGRREGRASLTHRHSYPTYISEDTSAALDQQALLDKVTEKLHLKEQELERCLAEYQRLDHSKEHVRNDGDRPLGYSQHSTGHHSTPQYDGGYWMHHQWTYGAPYYASGYQMPMHSPYYPAYGGTHPVGHPPPYVLVTAPHGAEQAKMASPVKVSPSLSDSPPTTPLPDFSSATAFHPGAGPGGISPTSHIRASHLSPSSLEFTPSFFLNQSRNSVHEKNPAHLSHPRPVRVSPNPGTPDHAHLTPQPRSSKSLDGAHGTHGRGFNQYNTVNEYRNGSAPRSRSGSQRRSGLQPITTLQGNAFSGARHPTTSTVISEHRPSNKPRRQTYAGALGKGLPAQATPDPLPTPPGSTIADPVTRSKYEILPPTPPALEPNALSLAWSEPLLEQLPSAWGTSDDGSTHSPTSTNSRKSYNRPRRRPRRKGTDTEHVAIL